ncbi:MAG: DUF885 domain-containing protein [Gammaproteobacteria bacterium]|nr:DUF885 domain-containing protein [Gammaproteobacteria bacterium]MDH3749352.1 DUF885 domain-containing protein [Gammaproteobacteria bacterium]MDH3805789.1 DUF885 domain-containing protein [Gammaproteobacteria bacterium]
MRLKVGAIVGALVLLTACGPTEDVTPTAAEGQLRNELFDAAVQKMTTAYFSHVPEAATQLGLSEDIVPGTGHRMMDRSVEGNMARNRALEEVLAQLKSIDSEALGPDRRRTHAVLTTLFEGALSPSRVVDYGTTAGAWTMWFIPYAIVQNSGPTVDIPNFLNSQQPVTNAEEAEAYLVRLASVGDALDGALESYRHGVQQGAIPPDFIVEKSLAVVEAFIEPAAGQNAMYLSFAERLEEAGIENAQAYTDRALKIIDADVIPAYQRIADYMGEIKASAPHDAGVWRLPNGEALYAAMIRHMTDSNASADDVHRKGLDEVNRITREMDQILRSEGYKEGTVGERMQQLNVEPRFLYANDAEGKEKLLNDVRAQVDGMYAELPNWFRRLPKHKVEVRMVPEFSQASAPIGYYNNPAPDGSRPGYYFINLRDTALHPSWTLPTLSYHEAVPGHHLDGATAMELEVPPLLKALWSNTSGEGWALYSERLAAEMGMYADDPYGDLGRLQAELHRAVRLVTDTGMHAKKWSREEAIEYMIDVEGLDEATATSEIERYVVWPAQALGYKLGQLKILALRDEARQALGDAFDIRDFNQQVLDVASAPLPFIETTVRNWIATSTN